MAEVRVGIKRRDGEGVTGNGFGVVVHGNNK